MLLTINYKGTQTGDIGFLLHKNPERPQEFELTYGKAYVFYPEISKESTTVALLLGIDPIDLARGKQGSMSSGLFDYVNDRPYVSSSFMSSAISKVFGTAMTGRCRDKQELADSKLNLTAKIHMLPCKGEKDFITKIFEPLGYRVSVETYINDEHFPEWGESKYVTLTLFGSLLLRDLLHHLYVLIPVFDPQKHYYFTKDEVKKLLKHGEGWLKTHPYKEYIISRYLNNKKSFVNEAMKILSDAENTPEEMDEIETKEDLSVKVEKGPNLNQQRLKAVIEAIRSCGAKTVLDLGCGEGNLITYLLREKQIEKITGVDVSFRVLEKAKDRLKLDRLPIKQREKLELIQGSVTYSDKRFIGYDVICVVEVMEHLDINRLDAFERILFELTKPKTAIITTPNVEYNINYVNMKENSFRHGDHRFEWTREQFIEWAKAICERHKYTVEFKNIGEMDEEDRRPTQMGVFTLCE